MTKEQYTFTVNTSFLRRWKVIPHISVGIFFALITWFLVSFIALDFTLVMDTETCRKAGWFTREVCVWSGGVVLRLAMSVALVSGWLASYLNGGEK